MIELVELVEYGAAQLGREGSLETPSAVPRPAWHDEDGIPCAEADPDAWFPPNGIPTRIVAEMCHDCPFREECLEDALAWGPEYGVWGGVTAAEIERERARRAGREPAIWARRGPRAARAAA